jgi:hypothetical protein
MKDNYVKDRIGTEWSRHADVRKQNLVNWKFKGQLRDHNERTILNCFCRNVVGTNKDRTLLNEEKSDNRVRLGILVLMEYTDMCDFIYPIPLITN